MSANGTHNTNQGVTRAIFDELNNCKDLVRTLTRKLGKEKRRRKNLEDELKTMKDKLEMMEGEADEMKEQIEELREDNANLAAAPKKYKRLRIIEDSEVEN